MNRLIEEDKENAAEEWIDKYTRRTGARSNLMAVAWTHCKVEETIWKIMGDRVYFIHGDTWGFVNYSDIVTLIPKAREEAKAAYIENYLKH